MKRLIVLGSTGSIGESTLDVVRAHPRLFSVAALSAHANADRLRAQAAEFGVERTALTSAERTDGFPTHAGLPGLLDMIRRTEADIVVNGIAGSSGLLPSLAALESGKDLALANKETLVMAGPLVRAAAERAGRRLLPVDSEHSGVFMLLSAFPTAFVSEIVLTASGGAFRDLPREALRTVSAREAMQHPTWRMGPKITIDSASLANKGLEVIEACRLFDFPPSRVRVLIHPQSRVHAMIRTRDGSMYSQMSDPDMRVPIQNALTHPELIDCPFGRLLTDGLELSFSAPDMEKFPLLPLAYAAAEGGAGPSVAYNAADEVAVQAFMAERIAFTDISVVVRETCAAALPARLDALEEILECDAACRLRAARVVHNLEGKQ